MATAANDSPTAARGRRSRPPAWAWIAAVAAVALFAALAGWQWQRGLAKERRAMQMAGAAAAAPVPLTAQRPPPTEGFERVRAEGEYVGGRQLLQDGQSHGGRPGFHVWTPLRLAGGGLVVVNRGWVPQATSLPDLAPPAVRSVTGLWRALPEPALRLGGGPCEPGGPFPRQVLYPRAEDLACVLGEPVAGGVLLLDPQDPGGYVREWAAPGLPPARHFAYALQWAALALAAAVLFVVLGFRRAR